MITSQREHPRVVSRGDSRVPKGSGAWPTSLRAGASSSRVTYNYEVRDFVSEEAAGLSVFYKNAAGEIFHTYSTFGRGDELVDTTYMYLDLTSKGRNEQGPHHNLGDWVRHHDRYEAAGFVDAGGRFVADQSAESACGCEHEGT